MTESKPNSARLPRQGNLIRPPVDERDAAPRRRNRSRSATPKPAGWLAYLALIILTIGSYAPIFSSDIVWSEYDEVERSPYQSMESWTEAWAPDVIRAEDPFSLTSYFIERKLPFEPAVTHHAINLMLHVIAAIFLLKTLDALKLPAAFSASLIFALHPAALQTIYWSGYREELIGLILLLAALYFGIRNRGAGDFLTLISISVIAYIVHPATLLLPLVLGLCIFKQHATFHLKDYNRLLPLLCLALFIGVWTQANQTGLDLSFSDRLSVYAQNLFFYLKQALAPIELSLFHPFDQSKGYSVGAQLSFLPFLLFIPFYVLIAINYRKQWARGILLGLTAYLLLIIYGLTKTGTFLDGSLANEDHLQYIALPCIIALITCTAGGIARQMGSTGKVLWYLGFTTFATIQIVITSSYAHTVSDRPQMWFNLSEQWPESWLPKLALIHTVQESGEESEFINTNEMIAMLESVLEMQPNRIEERTVLARLYRGEGQKSNALRQYKRILRDSKPDREFLRETAQFYDELGLTWDANNARARMTE
ncbi:tetratricopeptide repeat protein [Coraliomargarita sp. W4R53]